MKMHDNDKMSCQDNCNVYSKRTKKKKRGNDSTIKHFCFKDKRNGQKQMNIYGGIIKACDVY